MTKSHVLRLGLGLLLGIIQLSSCLHPAVAANALHFPEQKKFLVGLSTRQINNRDIFEYDDMISDELDLTYTYLEASYAVFNDLAVDLRLGSAKYNVSWIEYGSGIAWGLGLRTMLFRWEEQDMLVGAGFQYDKYNPDDTLRHGHYFSTDPDEWDISIEVAKSFNRLQVLGGIEYSEITLPFEHPERGSTREGGFKQDKELGIYFGAEVIILDNFGITGEVHLIADKSYSLGVFYKF